ncbi:MAG: N-acetylglucosamine-specific PTS transporter subunit IIBC [Elusimicrobiota bacterium]|jgi:PTS system N-acetylglucosamine-specific IIC component|nr:N-acetylglucosamine-specific PTS transporter subunit IIBC [Elusimicrobiota bacterium]
MGSVQKFFIKLGKSLMLPIAVLPIAGILMRIGQPDVLNIAFIATAGAAVFNNLPVIFAIGVAIGFSDDNHGAAALAGFVGHAIFLSALKDLLPNVNMGVLSGILMGVTAGLLYNKFKAIELPSYLAFFGGRRFVPIITGLAAIVLAYVFSLFWGPVDRIIQAGGQWIIGSGNIGLFSYGFLNRLLIPLGLHHILNSLVWFQFGTFTNAAGTVNGDLWRFFAGDPTAGSFMTGFFPIMMFGLLGAALAMVYTAEPRKRMVVMGIMLSSGLTAFLTGITEPLEFSFMFLAFPLYVVHAVLTGIAMVVMNLLDVRLGFTFSAGLFDYIISFGLAQNPIRLIPVGVAYFFVYFFLFTFAIRFWDIKTPGREDDDVIDTTEKEKPALIDAVAYQPSDDLYTAAQYVIAMGGKDNIISIGNCATRMRFEVKDSAKVDETKIKKLGARGVINKNGIAQVIIGTNVEIITDKVKKVLGK